MRRRILEKFTIDEISGVDRPCQVDARVAIMKRADPELESATSKRKEPEMDFARIVENICARDNCTQTVALRRARVEAPDAFLDYQGDKSEREKSYDELVQAELDKGAPLAVAGQRVLQKYGAGANATRVQKRQSAADEFMAEVEAVKIEKGCSKMAAMSEARRRHPDLYDAFQEA